MEHRRPLAGCAKKLSLMHVPSAFGTRDSLGGTRAPLGGTRAPLGRTRAPLGATSVPLGGTRAMRAWSGTRRRVARRDGFIRAPTPTVCVTLMVLPRHESATHARAPGGNAAEHLRPRPGSVRKLSPVHLISDFGTRDFTYRNAPGHLSERARPLIRTRGHLSERAATYQNARPLIGTRATTWWNTSASCVLARESRKVWSAIQNRMAGSASGCPRCRHRLRARRRRRLCLGSRLHWPRLRAGSLPARSRLFAAFSG